MSIGYVYFLQQNNGTKIGLSRDPYERMKDAKTWIPHIVSYGCFQVDNPELVESALHRYYSPKRKQDYNEWFDLDDSDIVKTVQSIKEYSPRETLQIEQSGIEELMNTAAAAEVLGITQKSLLEMVKNREIAHYKVSNRNVRFSRKHLEDFLRHREVLTISEVPIRKYGI